jgi:hypothetical protein
MTNDLLVPPKRPKQLAASIPDHPVIRNMERTGEPTGQYPEYPICPICRREALIFYENDDLEIVGCDNCIRERDAWEYEVDNRDRATFTRRGKELGDYPIAYCPIPQ